MSQVFEQVSQQVFHQVLDSMQALTDRVGSSRMTDRSRERDEPTTGAPGDGGHRSIDPIAARLDAIKNMPDVRLDRIEAMKRAIADGEFDTPERLNAAIRRMLDDLHRGE